WNNYSAAIDALHAQRNANQQAPGWQLSQEQRLEARVARLQQQLEATQNLIKARAELVKVLTPEQVKVLEALESKSHFRGHRGPRHHGFAPQRHHGFGPQGFGPQGAPAPMPKAPV
ncbi:Spy/CpxP family protein refolding chaperone, partial [Turicimonas muris]